LNSTAWASGFSFGVLWARSGRVSGIDSNGINRPLPTTLQERKGQSSGDHPHSQPWALNHKLFAHQIKSLREGVEGNDEASVLSASEQLQDASETIGSAYLLNLAKSMVEGGQDKWESLLVQIEEEFEKVSSCTDILRASWPSIGARFEEFGGMQSVEKRARNR